MELRFSDMRVRVKFIDRIRAFKNKVTDTITSQNIE